MRGVMKGNRIALWYACLFLFCIQLILDSESMLTSFVSLHRSNRSSWMYIPTSTQVSFRYLHGRSLMKCCNT